MKDKKTIYINTPIFLCFTCTFTCFTFCINMSKSFCNHWNYLLFDYTTNIGNIFHIPKKKRNFLHVNIKNLFVGFFLYLPLRF